VEFWAEHDEGKPVRERAFRVFGTGNALPPLARWIGTTPRTREGLVLHLYEIPSGHGFAPDGDLADWYRPGIEDH
jgi:hypothetical protein